MRFLCQLSKFSDVNKMSASNIAVVVAPNLLWPRSDPGYESVCVVNARNNSNNKNKFTTVY